MINATDTSPWWTPRRVQLGHHRPAGTRTGTPNRRPDSATVVALDVTVSVGGNRGRLISNAETDAHDEWTLVAVGNTDDAENVHVRVVDEERLLVEAGRSAVSPLILVSRHDDTSTEHRGVHRQLVAELADGGPALDLLGLSGASSVLVERTAACQPVPGLQTEPSHRPKTSRYVDTY